MERSKFMVSLVTNCNESNGASSSRTDSTSTSSLKINKINNDDALAENTNKNENGNCIELPTEIEEAMKLLMDDCGDQNDELLSLRDQLNSKYLLHLYQVTFLIKRICRF